MSKEIIVFGYIEIEKHKISSLQKSNIVGRCRY